MKLKRQLLFIAGVVLLSVTASSCGSSDTTDEVGSSTSGAPAPTTAPTTTEEIAGPADLTAASFTEDWNCGYGFWTSNADQTVALLIEFSDVDAAAAGQVPPIGNVPSVIWSGEVQIGEDLMANWCDDVVEESEPTPVIDETWTVVKGDITVTGEPPVQGCGPLSGKVSGLVVESPDGETISFVDAVDFENQSWGCFAG